MQKYLISLLFAFSVAAQPNRVPGPSVVTPLATQNASTLIYGTLPDARLSTNVVVRNGTELEVNYAHPYLYIRSSLPGATNDFLERISLTPDTDRLNDIVYLDHIDALETTAPVGTTSGTRVKNSSDDSVPISANGTYITAAHGPYIVLECTSNHDKTTAGDVGSLWSDGSATFELVQVVNGTTLWMVGTNAGSYWASFPTTIGATLTHITGATHTGNIVVSASARTQLRPSVKPVSKTVLLDGYRAIQSGVQSARSVRVTEIYELADPVAILAMLRTNATAAFTNAASLLRIENVYEWGPHGGMLNSKRVVPFQTLNAVGSGGVQCAAVQKSSGGTNLVWHGGIVTLCPPAVNTDLNASARLYVSFSTNSAGKIENAFGFGHLTEPQSVAYSGFVDAGGTKIYPLVDYREKLYATNTMDVIAFRTPMFCFGTNAIGFVADGSATNVVVLQLGELGRYSFKSSGLTGTYRTRGSTAVPCGGLADGSLAVQGLSGWSAGRIVLAKATDLQGPVVPNVLASNVFVDTKIQIGDFGSTTPSGAQLYVGGINAGGIRSYYYSPTIPANFYVTMSHYGNSGARFVNTGTAGDSFTFMDATTVLGTLSQAGNLGIKSTVTATNGLFHLVASNGIGGANIWQPARAKGVLMMVGDVTVDLITQSVYQQVTNYSTIATNFFTGSAANGTLTNTYAGWYDIRVDCSILGTTANSQMYECGVYTNGVECTLIEWQRTVNSTARVSAAASGSVYLPAGCRIDARIKSDAATPDDFTFGRHTLTVESW